MLPHNTNFYEMKNITILSDYIQQAEKSHSLEKEQIIDLLDSENPEILRQLCMAAGKCRKQFLGNEVTLINFFDIGENLLNPEVIERFLENADALGFTKVIINRIQGDEFRTKGWKLIAKKSKLRKLQLNLSLDKFELNGIDELKGAGVFGCRLLMGTFNEHHYRHLHQGKAAWNFSYALKCLETIFASGAEVTTGIMVGIPQTTTSDIAGDILYLQHLQAHHVEITKYNSETENALLLKTIALTRLLNPKMGIAVSPVLRFLPEAPVFEQLLSGANILMTDAISGPALDEICFHIKDCGFTICKDFENKLNY